MNNDPNFVWFLSGSGKLNDHQLKKGMDQLNVDKAILFFQLLEGLYS